MCKQGLSFAAAMLISAGAQAQAPRGDEPIVRSDAVARPLVERWASGGVRRDPRRSVDDSELVQARNRAREASLANARERLAREHAKRTYAEAQSRN
jgi:hypothetical protein